MQLDKPAVHGYIGNTIKLQQVMKGRVTDRSQTEKEPLAVRLHGDGCAKVIPELRG